MRLSPDAPVARADFAFRPVATLDVREGRGVKVLENLRAFFAGEPVPYPIRT